MSVVPGLVGKASTNLMDAGSRAKTPAVSAESELANIDTSVFTAAAAAELVKRIVPAIEICDDGPWMIPDFATMPNGREAGTVLVLGVGGSTLRVSRIHIPQMKMETLLNTAIPAEGKADVFTWAADQLHALADQFRPQEHMYISWSFPLVRGRLQTMGKNFDCEQYQQRSLQDCMNEKLHAAGVNIQVFSVTHDGAASLACGRFASADCHMALTLGTGININVVTEQGVMLNTEISMLGGTACPIELPTWPGIDNVANTFQPLEQRVGGCMLGTLAARLAGRDTTSWDTRRVWKVLDDDETVNPREWKAADAVATRAAFLVAVALYSVAQRFLPSSSRIVVACTGGVVLEPQFKRRVLPFLHGLYECTGLEMTLVPEEHGSEVGAAIMGLAHTSTSTSPEPASTAT